MPRVKTLIIGLLFLLAGPLLSGCSALRLGYGNGSQLAWWWVDGYFDFSREQAPLVKKGIDRWFEWHRYTQLPVYAEFLAQARQRVTEPTTPALACALQDRVRELAEPAIERAIAEFADVVPGLAEPQFKHLEQRYAKSNDEMRADFLQADPDERLRESTKRAVERLERIYGSLGDAQLKLLSTVVANSPFNPEAWLAERQRRQRDTLATLRKLVADKPEREARIAALRGLVQRSERSPNAEYRAYQVKLGDYNCMVGAQLHNATTAAQRQKARDNLAGWEADVRSLVVPPSGG